MANQLLVDLLTRTFASGALQHPGDANSPARVIPIPGFRATGMPDDQAQEMIGQAAKLWAEAIESVIDGDSMYSRKPMRHSFARTPQKRRTAPESSRCTTAPTTSAPRPCWC